MTAFARIGVVGAGMMGSEIALVFALAGHPTILSDQTREAALAAIARLHGVIDKGVARKFWSAEAGDDARRNLERRGRTRRPRRSRPRRRGRVRGRGAEARRIRAARRDSSPRAGIASNTSSISITSLSAALSEERRRTIPRRAFLLAGLAHAPRRGDRDRGHRPRIRRGGRRDADLDRQVADPREGCRRLRRQPPAARAGHRIDPIGRGGRLLRPPTSTSPASSGSAIPSARSN